MSKKVYIYGLYHPETSELRYIGKAVDLNNRLWCHIRDAKGGQRTHKAAWVRKLLSQGLKPVISVIWETTQEGWQVDEKACIAQAKQEGVRLTNLTGGGDGIIGYSHSDETKKKLRKYNLENNVLPPDWKGRKQSPEHIAKRVEARIKNDTYGHSEEAKKKISQKNTGKNMGNTHSLGYRHTDEWKEAQRKRSSGKNNPNYGKKMSDEAKKKLSKAKLGIKASKETKAKMSVAYVKRERAKREDHIARITIPHEDILTLSDDLRINEIRELYLIDGMIQKEIIAHLGLSPKSNRPRNRVKNAIETIPTIDNPNPEQPMLPEQLKGRKEYGAITPGGNCIEVIR